MSDEAADTGRLCPACGFSCAERPACRVCGGTGLVTPAQVREWFGRQTLRATSSSLRVVDEVRATLAAVRRRGTAQTAPLVELGEGYLSALEARQLSEDLALKCSEWLTAVKAMLRGER